MGQGNVRRIERANLSEQIETLMLLLSQNYRIFVVGHSQGNLFFNRNMQVLRHHGNSTGEKIATVAVATPADKIENGTKHFTFFEDKIIWGLENRLKFFPSENLSRQTYMITPKVIGLITVLLQATSRIPIVEFNCFSFQSRN
jgi:hypothetical protein